MKKAQRRKPQANKQYTEWRARQGFMKTSDPFFKKLCQLVREKAASIRKAEKLFEAR